MVAQHHFADRLRLDGAKQDLRRPGVVGGEAEVDDLADGGIAHQLVRHLHGDLHRSLCRPLVAVALDLLYFLRRFLPVTGEAYRALGTGGGGTADVADPLGSFDVAEGTLDRAFPDFAGLFLVEPLHRARPGVHGPIVMCGGHECKPIIVERI